MNADELMVGDLVMIKGQPKKIETAWSLVDAKMAEKDLQPIPISSEMLEANGFERNVTGDSFVYPFNVHGGFCSDYIDVMVNETNPRYRWTVGVQSKDFSCRKFINHIHELQHLMRIAAINKEINYVQGNN